MPPARKSKAAKAAKQAAPAKKPKSSRQTKPTAKAAAATASSQTTEDPTPSSAQSQGEDLPAPIHYLVEFTVLFEAEQLAKSSQLGAILTSDRTNFRAGAYISHCEELARDVIARKGLQTHLYRNTVKIYPLVDRKTRGPIICDWVSFDEEAWRLNIDPIIDRVAAEAKKGTNPTISVEIITIYSRFRDHLPDPEPVGAPAPPPSTPAPAAQQTTAAKSPSKLQSAAAAAAKAKSTTQKMLVESRIRDLTRDSSALIPLVTKWRCRYDQCTNHPNSGSCYVLNRQHYRIPTWIFGVWQALIDSGDATDAIMPHDLLKQCLPAAKPRREKPQRSSSLVSAAQAQPQQPPYPYPYPYMMPQLPMQLPTPYMAYPPPFYPPPYPPQGQPAAPHQHQNTPPTSSPPRGNHEDPDVIIKGYLDDLIERYPLQTIPLRAAQDLLLKEAIDVDDLWTWLQEPEKFPKLAVIAPGLRKRIKTHLKFYLHLSTHHPDTLPAAAETDIERGVELAEELNDFSSQQLVDDEEEGGDDD